MFETRRTERVQDAIRAQSALIGLVRRVPAKGKEQKSRHGRDWKRGGRDSNPQPPDRQSGTLTNWYRPKGTRSPGRAGRKCIGSGVAVKARRRLKGRIRAVWGLLGVIVQIIGDGGTRPRRPARAAQRFRVGMNETLNSEISVSAFAVPVPSPTSIRSMFDTPSGAVNSRSPLAKTEYSPAVQSPTSTVLHPLRRVERCRAHEFRARDGVGRQTEPHPVTVHGHVVGEAEGELDDLRFEYARSTSR